MFYDELASKLKQFSIQWMFDNLRAGSVLDVGSAESTYIMKLLTEGYDVTRIDTRYSKQIADETILVSPIEVLKPGSLYFDNIVLLSTLEHIGLNWYGNQRVDYPLAYQRGALLNCFGLLKPKGRVLVSLPYGQFVDMKWYLVYGEEELDDLCLHLNLIRKGYYAYSKEMGDYHFVSKLDYPLEPIISGYPDLNGEVLLVFEGS